MNVFREQLCPVGATAERLENSSRIHSFVHHDAEEGEHHLFPSHVAVIDGLVRIGIELIISGIIVMRRDDELGALWDLNRLFEIVGQLPIEVIMRHVQNGFHCAVGELQLIGHVFAAHMHVGKHVHQLDILLEDGFGRRAGPVGVVGRDGEMFRIAGRRYAETDVAPLGSFPGHSKTDERAIGGFFPLGV